MKLVRIAFLKTYYPQQFHREDYFIEYELEKGDTLDECFKKAKQETFEQFTKNNPQITWNKEKEPDIPIINLAPLERGISNNRVEAEPYNYHSPDIEAVKKEMQSYKKNIGAKAFKSVYGEMVKDSPELKEIYEQKLKELQ